MGTDGHGSAGLPELSEYCAESVLLYVFYVCEAASFVLLTPQVWSAE